MLEGWRAKRAFKREAKRLARLGEPVVWNVSQAIYEDYVRSVELFEAYGYRPSEDRAHLEKWGSKEQSKERRRSR